MQKFVIFFLSIILGASVFGTVNAQPVPSALVATTASATQINLTWINNGSNIGFQIERSLTSGSGFTLIATTAANVTSYADTGLTPGTTYFYRVRAVYGSSSYSAYTSEASATATNPIYVVPPNTLIATTVSTTQINLTWIVNGSNTGFQIERSSTSGSGFTLIATTAANVTSYSNTGLTPSNIYFYRVRALYGSSYSSYTSEASASTFASSPPSAPISLTATAISTTQINLTWGDNSTNETGFQIERSLTSGSGFTLVTTTAANATSYSNTSLTAGTKYFYRVRAINSAGNSAFTSEASATTLSPPVAPSQAHATTASSSSAIVTWQDNSVNETGFQIERSITGGSGYVLIATTAANVITFTDTGLASGTVYYYRIRAINSIGNSVYTNEASVLTSPAPPNQLVAQAQSCSTVKLTWANSNGQASFQIERSISQSSGYTLITTTAANIITFTDTGLAPVTLYYYRIRASNASGNSSYTATVSAQTFTADTPPAVPSGLTAQVTLSSAITLNSFITLNWTDNSANETGFEVYRWPGVTGSGMELISTTPANVNSFVDERLPSEGTNYIYRVRSINTFGNSALCEVLIYLPYFNNYNWIKETVVLQKGVLDETQVAIASGQKSVTWSYFDGLGRPVQTVSVASSPSGGDIVQPIIYDVLGRETKKYLPYKSAESNGWYKTLPVGTNSTDYSSSPQAQFYQTGGLVAKDDNPYSATTFESSPLSRVLEQGEPGAAWQPDNTDSYSAPVDRSIKMAYLSNAASEVRLWKYSRPAAASPLGIVTGTGTNPYYAANQLYKKSTKDEQWNEVIEYVDNQGRTVLKRVQAVSGTPSVDDSNYASTYYIYDDIGSLVCVVPPEASKSLTSTIKPFSWGSITGLAVGTDNTLTKTVATGYANSGAYYATGLAASTSGWVRMIASETNTSRMIGFASSNAGTDTNIGFALELANNGHIYVWEDGTKKNDLGTYQAGTSVMISRENGYVKYYVDNVYKITSSKTTSTSLSTTALYVDVTINETGGTIKDVDISFSSEKSTLNNYAYFYTYDTRRRMSQKQVPGADPVYMVYDNRDRLVLTQDGNQRKDASSNPLTTWLFTKYDALNRSVLTGIYTADSSLTQSKMQDRINRFYKSGGAWFESPKTSTGNVHGYDNVSFPSVVNQNQYLTATYYDDYSFKSLFGSTEYDFKSNELPPDAVNGYPGQITTAFTGTLGLVTGSKVKMLSGNSWLKSVNYYDDHYRVVQNITDNIKGYTVATNTYDFVGKVLRTKSSLFLGQPVTWANLTGVQLQSDVLSSTGTGSWGDVTTSSQVLPANTDGWFEITFGNNTPYLEIGLVDVYSGSSYTNIDYGWFIQGLLTYAKENGTTVWSTGSTSPGDVFRIERVNGIIYYKRNGIVYYKSSVPSTTSLLAQVSFFTAGAKVSQGRLSNTFIGGPVPVAASYFVKRYDYDHASRLLKTWHQIKDGSEILLTYNVYNELGQLIDKKLYNTDLPSVADNSRSFKQSVDYRYNIRGWLTSINNSTLSLDATTNDDTGDLFGMNLSYEQPDASLGNAGLYNGNISGMRWNNYLGAAPVKENGYKFGYDAMNRLTAANSRANKAGTWQTGDYSENGLTYDLNGNIQSLSRRSDGKIVIDSLGYNYGSGISLSNKLLSVTDKVADATNKAKGFSDGNTAGNDYTYDWNGNLLTDKNKSITVPIIYSHLNLPTTVVRSYSNINYLYDATGNKHGQVATYGTTQKFTDYVGPWIFENNELQFLQHDEGPIMLTSQQKVYTSSCDVANTDFVSTANVTLTTITINGEKYIQVTPTVGINMNKLGISQIGNVISVTEGERYVFRVKGYNGAAANANLYVKGNIADVLWPGACLPYTAVNESWVEESFIIPTGVTQITLGVLFNSTALATTSNVFYINEIEFYKKTSLTPEYQYNLKDHLGNVRVTFTSTPETVSDVATLESSNLSNETSKFLRRDRVRVVVNNALFDHTNDATATSGGSIRLSGSANEKTGLVKSIAVMPGDVVNMEVWAKYIDSNTSNWTGALTTALMNAIAAGTGGTVSDGNNYPSNGSTPFPYTGLDGTGNSTGVGPKAYLNYIMFDKDFNPIINDPSQTNYVRLSDIPKEHGQNVAHEKLSANVTVKQAGYMYIYLSNEETTPVEVYFDDFKVTQAKSSVIASNDYYSFGLKFNSYSRENSMPNKMNLFQSQEHTDDLGLNWDSYRYRNHQPDIGRFFNIDPMASAFYYNSPYAFSENKVTTHREMEGLEAFFIHGTGADNSMWKKDVADFIMRELKPYFSTEQTADTGFKWNDSAAKPTPGQSVLGGGALNWLDNNGETDRAEAARMLVAYILKHRKEGQGITLVGHSHGGNVAIQAARILFEKHNIQVNIVNFNTPAWNGTDDPENPWDNFGIGEMLHFFTDGDYIAGPLSGESKYGGLVGSNVQQIELKHPLKTSFFGTEQHYFDNVNWQEVLNQFSNMMNNTNTEGNKTKKQPDADAEAKKKSG